MTSRDRSCTFNSTNERCANGVCVFSHEFLCEHSSIAASGVAVVVTPADRGSIHCAERGGWFALRRAARRVPRRLLARLRRDPRPRRLARGGPPSSCSPRRLAFFEPWGARRPSPLSRGARSAPRSVAMSFPDLAREVAFTDEPKSGLSEGDVVAFTVPDDGRPYAAFREDDPEGRVDGVYLFRAHDALSPSDATVRAARPPARPTSRYSVTTSSGASDPSTRRAASCRRLAKGACRLRFHGENFGTWEEWTEDARSELPPNPVDPTTRHPAPRRLDKLELRVVLVRVGVARHVAALPSRATVCGVDDAGERDASSSATSTRDRERTPSRSPVRRRRHRRTTRRVARCFDTRAMDCSIPRPCPRRRRRPRCPRRRVGGWAVRRLRRARRLPARVRARDSARRLASVRRTRRENTRPCYTPCPAWWRKSLWLRCNARFPRAPPWTRGVGVARGERGSSRVDASGARAPSRVRADAGGRADAGTRAQSHEGDDGGVAPEDANVSKEQAAALARRAHSRRRTSRESRRANHAPLGVRHHPAVGLRGVVRARPAEQTRARSDERRAKFLKRALAARAEPRRADNSRAWRSWVDECAATKRWRARARRGGVGCVAARGSWRGGLRRRTLLGSVPVRVPGRVRAHPASRNSRDHHGGWGGGGVCSAKETTRDDARSARFEHARRRKLRGDVSSRAWARGFAMGFARRHFPVGATARRNRVDEGCACRDF